MDNPYRDPLVAILSRNVVLERENARLRTELEEAKAARSLCLYHEVQQSSKVSRAKAVIAWVLAAMVGFGLGAVFP